jgi:hypothetical protein
MTQDRPAAAEKLKRLLIDASPLIEEYTSAVCPACADVCCRQKHGMYRERDIRYLAAAGEEAPRRNGERPLDGPCEAMGAHGCVLPRWLRPFKCTWYFCNPLLEALAEGRQKKARQLSAVLREMVELYGEIAE